MKRSSVRSSIASRLVWILLVVIVPILASTIIIGAALQFVGVPVLSTVETYVGLKKPANFNQTTNSSQTSLSAANDKIQQLTQENATLTAELSTEKQQEATMQSEITQLQNTVAEQVQYDQQAHRESVILAGMDAPAAASVLDKMAVKDAGAVIAQMSSDAAGQILAALDASKASEILAAAAAYQAAPTNQTSNNTTGSTTNQAG